MKTIVKSTVAMTSLLVRFVVGKRFVNAYNSTCYLKYQLFFMQVACAMVTTNWKEKDNLLRLFVIPISVISG